VGASPDARPEHPQDEPARAVKGAWAETVEGVIDHPQAARSTLVVNESGLRRRDISTRYTSPFMTSPHKNPGGGPSIDNDPVGRLPAVHEPGIDAEHPLGNA